jgi:DNA mismatch repair protein MutL
MPKIIQLSPHIANLIAAGEVVERPASVVKELLENAVDAGATKVTVEIKDGGMTFLRLTDNGCGMSAEDARTAFLRHATSKLRTEEDLAAISTFGFRGEALAAVASVSRIDLLTKTADSLSGTSLHLEAGVITEDSEAGCPDGTTIIVRDLFFNTPARMKFMKSDTVEGSRVTAAVQTQALAHPEVAITLLRDGKQILSTPGTGDLQAAVYCIYGRELARMAEVRSQWEQYQLTGFVSRPTDARPSRAMQTFFVNGRPVKSKIMIAALEEAYRNQIMVGKFPACVLHLTVPAHLVDVNVHPAKTEVKFLQEKAVFDCIHYGVLGALNKTPDRPQVQFSKPKENMSLQASPQTGVAIPSAPTSTPTKKDTFFRTMTPEEYKAFSQAMTQAPQPKQEKAVAAAVKVAETAPVIKQNIAIPSYTPPAPVKEVRQPEPIPAPVQQAPAPAEPEVEQVAIEMPQETPWRLVGELFNSYIVVEQGEDAFLIDKHAAHERILFEKLKANQERITSQMLLQPIPVRLPPAPAAELLSNQNMLEELGFEIEEFGAGTLLLRQIPMDLSPDMAAEALEALAADLLSGRREHKDTVRDEILHTVACKAAIKAGWNNGEEELLALVKQVMADENLKHCPHGRPICITLSKKQLEKQFKRT